MEQDCVLLDTSFFIRLLNEEDPLHNNALGYFRYFLEHDFVIKRLTRQSPWRSLTKTPTIFNGLSFKFATFATWNIKQT